MNRRCFLGGLAVATTTLGMGSRAPERPKYVFYFIGDGMGTAQRRVAERYARMKHPSRSTRLAINQADVTALTSTDNSAGKTTDSAAAGTALACGEKTLNQVLGLKADKKTPVRSIAFDAKDAGMKVGLVTSVPIDHATPAAFYARVPSRKLYYEIDEQLAQSGFDYFAGEPMIGRAEAGERTPPRHLVAEAGYGLVDTPVAFHALRPGAGPTLVELDMGHAIESKAEVSLADLTRKGIELLDNDVGFFMMIEGGKIDWTGHANDLAANIHETLAFDDAARVALEFLEKHRDETLIVVTADHETGGLELLDEQPALVPLTDARRKSAAFYANQVLDWKKSGTVDVDAAYDRLTADFGLKDLSADSAGRVRAAIADSLSAAPARQRSPQMEKMYGKKNAAVTSCLRASAIHSGARWTSFNHTSKRVETTAWGRWAPRFAGENDNTDLAIALRELITS